MPHTNAVKPYRQRLERGAPRVTHGARATDAITGGISHRLTLPHRRLAPQQAELIGLAIANYRTVQRLVKAWKAPIVRLIELRMPAQARGLTRQLEMSNA
jgi:hypothetical protein